MAISTAETIYDYISDQSGGAVPTGKAQNQVGNHREFKIKSTDGAQQLYLSLQDTEMGIYNIPLGLVDSHEKTDSSDHKNILIPVVPATYTDQHSSTMEATVPRESGYIYIFKGDFLWRELKVLKNGRYNDVNLHWYQGEDIRSAASAEIDTRILMPYKIDGKIEKLAMCYSEVQWSWMRINSMGGMEPSDIRINQTNPPLLAKACGFTIEIAAKNRSDRMQEIDLSGYDSNFPTVNGNDVVAGLENSNSDFITEPHLKQHKESNIPIVYLSDPLGVAENLKQKHIRSAKDTELIAGYMAAEDYSLAKLVKIIVDSEKTSVGAGVAKKLENHSFIKSVQLGGNFNKLNSYQQEQSRNAYIRKYEEEVKEAADIAKVVDINKVDETLKFWDDLDKKSLKDMTQNGQDVVDYMDLDIATGVIFETAMMDYFESDNPVYISLGIARLVYYLEYFTFKSGLIYIKKIADKKNKIGVQIQLPAVINKARPVIIKLENGDLKNLRVKDTGFKLDTATITSLSLKATNAYSKLLESLSKTKILDVGGLNWLVTLTKGYLGSDFNISIEKKYIHKLFYNKKVYPKNVFRHLPKIEAHLNIKTQYIAFNNELPSQTFTRLSESASHKTGFLMVQGVLATINAANAISTLSKAKVATVKDKMAVAAAVNDVLSFGVALVDEYASLANKYHGKAQTANQQKLNKISTKAEAMKISRSKSKGGINAKKTDVEKILQKKYKKAYKIQLKISYQVAKYAQWTKVASHASSYLGVIGSVLGVGLSLHELLSQNTTRGKIAASVLLASSSLSFVMSIKAIRMIKVVSGLSKLTRVGMLTGAATAESGVGLILFGVCLVVDVVGGAYLNEVNRSWLLKALEYCHFGEHPYGDWKLFDDNMHNRTVTKKTGLYFFRTYHYKYDFPAECAEIYRRLFGYEGKVILAKIPGPGSNDRDSDIKILIKGKIDLTQFTVGKSYFDLNIKVKYYNSSQPGDLFLLKDLKIRKIKSKDGILIGLEVYREIDVYTLSQIKQITMSTSLDIEGDGNRVLPKQVVGLNDQGIDEKEQVEFKLTALGNSNANEMTDWRIHNVGWEAKGGVKYDGNYQVGLKEIKQSDYDLAKDYVETS